MFRLAGEGEDALRDREPTAAQRIGSAELEFSRLETAPTRAVGSSHHSLRADFCCKIKMKIKLNSKNSPLPHRSRILLLLQEKKEEKGRNPQKIPPNDSLPLAHSIAVPDRPPYSPSGQVMGCRRYVGSRLGVPSRGRNADGHLADIRGSSTQQNSVHFS